MTRRAFKAPLAIAAALAAACAALLPPTAVAQSAADAAITDARDAARRGDRAKLVSTRATAEAAHHPLAGWVDYWELGSRLRTATADEVEAFYARRSGSYVEDRLRNDWLLELGHRRDWPAFTRDYPRFRMADDRAVACYAILVDHLAGQNVREAARAAWMVQNEADEGCQLLARTMVEAGRFTPSDVWDKVRLSVDGGRLKSANAAASLLDPSTAQRVSEALDNPARFLARGNGSRVESPRSGDLTALAIVRAAASDAGFAVDQLRQRDGSELDPDAAGWAWAATAHQAAMNLDTQADDFYAQAWRFVKRDAAPRWGDDILGWNVRASLRAARPGERWRQALRAIDAMSPGEQREAAWVYWKARALVATARPADPQMPTAASAPDAAGAADPRHAEADALLETIADPWSFYGALALEDLGRSVALPSRPLPPTPAERDAARTNAGLTRALLLFDLGLRGEAIREWNFSLRGLDDRALLAAAQMACDRQIWDRCINTSDRTRREIDVAQRFPMPFREEVVEAARATGVDPAYVYGLIRQESRFVIDARSSAGASGLMQLMPATARLVAKRAGIELRPGATIDRGTNLKLGTAYLKSALDDFDGSEALAAAAYNAGPGRPRRWREGPSIETAIWAENIPFGETRDYVKKVLSNTVLYSQLLGSRPASLKGRLGESVGPRDRGAPPGVLP